MEFGVAFATKIGDFDLVAHAERLGFHQAWFFDSQMIYSDVYATMALAAHHTKRIRLATGVAVPTTRMAPVIAHSIATINALAPGRVELGVGNGNTARLTMGLPPVSLARMGEELRVIRTLLDGGTATFRAEGLERQIRLLHPRTEQGFVQLEPRIPITLSALGPKTLAWCGAEMDGHLTWGTSPEALREARGLLEQGARKAGRDGATIPSKGIFPTAVLRQGETSASPRILHSLGSFITNYLHVQIEWGEALLPPAPKLRNLIERYRAHVARYPHDTRYLRLHEGHLVYAREDEREFLRPEIAEVVANVGEPDALIERIRALEAAGLSHYALQVTDDPIGQMNDFAERVMRRY